MNEDLKNRERYQAAFNEVHAPEALARKVKNMSETKKNKSVPLKKISAAAAAIAVVFVGSNAITYAATGSTWVRSVIVYFNGTAKEMELTECVDGNGNTYYGGMTEDESGAPVYFAVDSLDGEIPDEINPPEVVEENGKVYLKDGDVLIDVTEDVEDGETTGTYEKDGAVYSYNITGENGNWNLEISLGLVDGEE